MQAPMFCPPYVDMPTPKASNAQQHRFDSFEPAVTAATAPEPSRFTDACRMTLPMAVIENCSPIGKPIFKRIFTCSRSSFASSRVKHNKRNRLRTNNRQQKPEMACEITVATAAPATPIGITTTSSKSSTTLMTDESTKNKTGVLLSPSARRALARIL